MTTLLWIGAAWVGSNILIVALGWAAARNGELLDRKRDAEILQLEELLAMPSASVER